jgi:class 3 adenylate cyclase
VTIAISIGFFASAVSKSTKQIRTKFFEETIALVDKQISDTTLAHQMSFNALDFNVTDETSVIRNIGPVFIRALKLLPLVSIVYCSKSDGGFAGFIRNTRNTSQAYFTSSYPYPNYALQYFVTIKDLNNYLTWSPNNTVRYPAPMKGIQPYTILAKNSSTTAWTNSYTSANHIGEIYLTLTRPIRHPVTNQFLGSCQFDFLVRLISNYLSEGAKQEQNSVSVVVEASTGLLIGSSDTAVQIIYQTVNVTKRFDNSQGSNKRMDAMLAFARENYGGHNLTSVVQNRIYDSFYFNGQKNILNIGRITDQFGLDWIMLQSFPMRNFYYRFYNSIIVMICATVALIIISVIVSILIATAFMRPINMLVKQAEAIKLLQLEKVEKSLKQNVSFFTEIYTLQQTFESMTGRLKQFRNFIPDHILAVIEEEIGVKAADAEMSSRGSKDSMNKGSETHTGTDTMNMQPYMKNMVNNALNSSLVSGNITIMTIKLPDFSSILELHGANEVNETSKELLSQFTDIIRISKGQLVSISSTKAIVAWNTFITQSDHRIRACKVAHKCLAALKKLHDKWKSQNLPLLDISIAITSGITYYGNMGTHSMKFYTIIGPAMQRASTMYKSTSKWGVTVVCDANVYNTAQEEYQLRPLFTLEDENSSADKKIKVYELGEMKSSDTWANELGDNNNKDDSSQWKVYNDAYELYESEQYEEAYEQFLNYLSKNAQDVASQNMIAICKQQKEEHPASTTTTDPTTSVVPNE